jgi:hypothetical protein
MASVGVRKRVSARTGRVTCQVWWLLDDGSQGAQTVTTSAEARALEAEKQLEIARGAWQGRRRGRLTFDRTQDPCGQSERTEGVACEERRTGWLAWSLWTLAMALEVTAI